MGGFEVKHSCRLLQDAFCHQAHCTCGKKFKERQFIYEAREDINKHIDKNIEITDDTKRIK